MIRVICRSKLTRGIAIMTAQYSTADMEALFESVKNWGRWGKEDERGARNFITTEKQLLLPSL